MSPLLLVAPIIFLGIPALLIAWALLLVIFHEAAFLVVATVLLIPVFGPWVIVVNALGFVAIRALSRGAPEHALGTQAERLTRHRRRGRLRDLPR